MSKRRASSTPITIAAILAWFEKNNSPESAAKLSRYGLPTTNAYGIPVGSLRKYAKRIGRDHDLAMKLWKTGSLDARLLASFIGEPDKITIAQMNAWCRDFDDWGTTDTACFALFDRSPLAWKVIAKWISQKGSCR